jgi:death on curing protein
MMQYLLDDDILDLHTFAVQRFGGRLGIRSQDRLEAVVSLPQLSMFGTELYPDLPSKLGAVGYMMLKDRPFNGANEATTMLMLLRLLAINGLTWDVGFPRQLASALQGVLHSEWTQDIFTEWLRATFVAGNRE